MDITQKSKYHMKGCNVMKSIKNRIIIAITVAAVLAATCVSALAAADETGGWSVTPVQPSVTTPSGDTTLPIGPLPPQLTDEQRAEFQAQMEARRAQFDAMQNKWSALTDAQKEEIYAMKDKAMDIDAQIIDKYLEWGVIDADTAAEMKSNLETRKSDMRTNGRMPMMGGGRGDRGGRGGMDGFMRGMPDATQAQPTTTSI